jgi:Tol biopolymer transport system component
VKAADNSGPEQMLFSERGGQNPTAWISPDTILVQSTNGPQMDLFTFSLKSSKATPYLQGPWFEGDVQVSPDGKLAAFVSQEGGNNDVWLRDFPVPNGKWQVSATGGRMPRWSPDGKDLYYWRQGFAFIDSLYRVRIDRTPSVRVNSPQLVLTHDIISTEGWDIHPDGKRFVMVQLDVPRGVAGPGAPTSRYVIIPNWFTELKAKTAGKK